MHTLPLGLPGRRSQGRFAEEAAARFGAQAAEFAEGRARGRLCYSDAAGTAGIG
jgi:hypothetical protein